MMDDEKELLKKIVAGLEEIDKTLLYIFTVGGMILLALIFT